MEIDRLYKHINGRDIAIRLLSYPEEYESHYVCYVAYHNISSPKKFVIDFDYINIKKSDIQNWKLYE